jgi:hypothetical protein
MMGGSSFDLIAQELLKHKKMMEQMEQENRELRRQLADLRAGRGFFIEIDGQRFSLPVEAIASPQVSATASQSSSTEPLVEEQVIAQPTTEIPQSPVVAEQNETARQTQQLVIDELEIQPTSILPRQTEEETTQQQQEPAIASPTFLEEVMIDEFTVATTSPLSVWSAPKQEQKPEDSEDEELKLLREQLIGSYLLE